MKATVEQIIKALEAKAGFVSEAAKALGISYQAINQRINKNQKLKDVYDAINEGLLDFTESKLLKLIKDENLGAICFHLKCKGKHRGWVERQELEHSGTVDKPIIIKVIYEKDRN